MLLSITLQLHMCHLSLLTNLVFVIPSMSSGNRFTSVLLCHRPMLPFSKILHGNFHCVVPYSGKLWMSDIKSCHLVFVQFWTAKRLQGTLLQVNWAFFDSSVDVYMDKHFVSLHWKCHFFKWRCLCECCNIYCKHIYMDCMHDRVSSAA